MLDGFGYVLSTLSARATKCVAVDGSQCFTLLNLSLLEGTCMSCVCVRARVRMYVRACVRELLCAHSGMCTSTGMSIVTLRVCTRTYVHVCACVYGYVYASAFFSGCV